MKTNSNNSLNSATETGIIFYLADGTIQSCNVEAANILGYAVEKLIGASYFALPWQIANHQDTLLAQADLKDIFTIEQSFANVVVGFKKPNQKLISLTVESTALFKANGTEPYGVEVSFRETAQNNIKTSQLPQSKKLLTISVENDLVELLPGVIYIYDVVRNHSIYVNSEFYDSLGYTPQEIAKFTPSFICQVMHPEDAVRFFAHVKKLSQAPNEKVYRFEYRMQHKNGSWRWFSSQDKVYSRTADGSVEQVVGIARDITSRKEAETAFQKSEERLNLATEASGIGMWFWNLRENTVEWTRLGKVIFGLTSDDTSTLEQCFDQIHPEDRDRIRIALNESLTNRTEYSVEYRIVLSDYSIRWIAAKGKGFYHQDGQPLQMMGTIQDITARKKAEKQLEENEKLLRLALSNAKAGTWSWDIINQQVVWSPENYELYGVDPKIDPLRYQDWASSLHPDDIEKSNLEVQKVLSGESTEFRTQFRIIHPQKGVRWLFGIGNVTRNDQDEPIRLSGINLDISDLSIARQALQKREYELELVTKVIPQQVWTALADGEIDYCNQRWLEYTGFSSEQCQSKYWESIIHPDDLLKVSKNWQKAVISGHDYNIEARLRRADGEYHWFLVRAKPLKNEQGAIIKWYGTNTNINRIKKLESQLLQQTEDLSHANQLKDEFLAIVSHELRTPLNPILGWSQLLLGGNLDAEKTAKGISIIERNANLQAQLIEDLLDVSRILRGKLELKKVPVNLELVIKSALATVHLSAEAKSLQIETYYEPHICQVLGDASRLQQIVWNLLSNAIKFTTEGGNITVKLERIGSLAQIEVKDTGTGIEPNFLPYVFDRFRQAESSSTRQFGGLGLGLAIVRYLTELHEGIVTVESPGLNRGTTFRVNLPLVKREISETTETALKSSEPSLQTNRFSGVKILAIDDAVDSLGLLSFVLEQEGARVITATTAEEAVSILQELTPDLIISDIEMPKISGYELITQIRQLSQGKNIPAIALTAYAGDTNSKRSIEAGFDRHLTKPIDIAKLMTTITEMIIKD